MKVIELLESIRSRAMDHSAFDAELFKSRDVEMLADIGGDVFDWTITAIEAHDALNSLRKENNSYNDFRSRNH